jgi:aryl-alcohol dehydrogenase-like predicted oxidoreductase
MGDRSIMQFNSLGDSGIEVSRVGLGCDNFGWRPGMGLRESRAVVDAALDAGITFFDTAEAYGDGDSERFLGDVFNRRHDRVVLATKFGVGVQGGGSRPYIRRAIDGSLSRLGVGQIDLYYYHQPDGVTPLDETLSAMQELVAEGKVRAIACSQFQPDLLREAEDLAEALGRPGFVAVQNEYSLLHREPEIEMLDVCDKRGIGFVPYFPLASGLLTGKYRRSQAPPPGSRLERWRPPVAGVAMEDRPEVLIDSAFDVIEPLERWARDHGRQLAELAIAYLASQPAVVSVIAGAMTPEQVQANAAAADWHLSSNERSEIGAIASGYPSP